MPDTCDRLYCVLGPGTRLSKRIYIPYPIDRKLGTPLCVLSPTEHLLGRGTTKETTRDHVQETYAHMGPGRQRGRDAP